MYALTLLLNTNIEADFNQSVLVPNIRSSQLNYYPGQSLLGSSLYNLVQSQSILEPNICSSQSNVSPGQLLNNDLSKFEIKFKNICKCSS